MRDSVEYLLNQAIVLLSGFGYRLRKAAVWAMNYKHTHSPGQRHKLFLLVFVSIHGPFDVILGAEEQSSSGNVWT